MTGPPREPRIFVSVAEQSADEHAAGLILAFREIRPALFRGLAGPAMRAAGCECLEDMSRRSAMALAALSRVPEAVRLLGRLRRHFSRQRYDAAVLVDSPALNLPIAKLCRRRGIPVLYYIAPQTWAWGPRRWRNRRVRERVDRLACLWPFEQPYFRAAGIPATYVGHPTIDRLIATKPDRTRIEQLRAGASFVVLLLPGSRRHVVEEVLPGQLEVAEHLAARFRGVRFLVVAANAEMRTLIESHLAGCSRRFDATMLSGEADRDAAIRAADLTLVASGTATLEVAYRATPMIVMYNAGRWSYRLLGRWLITTRHLSIPNILADREIVPEFMPYYRSTDAIAALAVEWLSTPETLAGIRKDLRETIRPILKSGAAGNTARELAALLEQTQSTSGALAQENE